MSESKNPNPTPWRRNADGYIVDANGKDVPWNDATLDRCVAVVNAAAFCALVLDFNASAAAGSPPLSREMLEAERDALRGTIGDIHEALGEHRESDDTELAQSVRAWVRAAKAKNAELETLREVLAALVLAGVWTGGGIGVHAESTVPTYLLDKARRALAPQTQGRDDFESGDLVHDVRS